MDLDRLVLTGYTPNNYYHSFNIVLEGKTELNIHVVWVLHSILYWLMNWWLKRITWI